MVIDGNDALKVVPDSSLGVLREEAGKQVSASFAALPAAVRAYARRPELLVITKSTARSTVHRPGYLDYIAVKRFDATGKVCGEDRFLGLFTSTAYSANPSEIPLLRRKTANVVAASGVEPGGHAAKALRNILVNYPRDELFQIAEEDLLRIATGILQLGERQRFRLFVRRDPFERFLSCMIYAPRENYTTELRQKWQAILTDAFNGSSSEFNVHLSESALARIHITVRTTPGAIPAFDVRDVEARLIASARRWSDDLKAALIGDLGEAQGLERLRQFAAAFPAGYRDEYPARAAVPDIAMMTQLTPAMPLAMSLYRPLEAPPGTLRFQLSACLESAMCAVRQPADARTYGTCGCSTSIRTGSRRRRHAGRSRCTISGIQSHDARRRPRGRNAARGVRGRVRPHLPRRRRERRLQPAGDCRTHSGRRSIVVLRAYGEIPAADRLPAVAGVHRGHARRACRTSRGCWSDLFRTRASTPPAAMAPARARPNDERAIEGRARKRRKPVRGPRAAPVPGA